MTEHLLAAYAEDIRLRIGEAGERPGGIPPIVHVHEIEAGLVYKDEAVTVTAFPVPHGTWDQAFGFRFVTPDKTVVISGDTSYSSVIAKQCNGCDVLVHEGGYPDDHNDYSRRFHTNADEIVKIANEARPKLLVLTHQRNDNREGLRIIQAGYSGQVVVASDLDVFE
jgi:ribonuclease Z